MTDFATPVSVWRFGASFGAFLAACLGAFGGWPLGRTPRPPSSPMAAALLVVAGTSAQVVVAGDWSGGAVQPAYAAGAVLLAVLATVVAYAAFDRCEGGVLSAIAGGAIFGAGATLSEAAALAAVRDGSAQFDDVPLYLAVTVCSAAASASLSVFRRWPGISGRRAAAVVLALGMSVSGVLAHASLQGAPWPDSASDWKAPIGLAVALVVLATVAVVGRGAAVRTATMATVSSGSRPPFPSQRPAGTGSPRPWTVRSAAGPAAGPVRRDRRED